MKTYALFLAAVLSFAISQSSESAPICRKLYLSDGSLDSLTHQYTARDMQKIERAVRSGMLTRLENELPDIGGVYLIWKQSSFVRTEVVQIDGINVRPKSAFENMLDPGGPILTGEILTKDGFGETFHGYLDRLHMYPLTEANLLKAGVVSIPPITKRTRFDSTSSPDLLAKAVAENRLPDKIQKLVPGSKYFMVYRIDPQFAFLTSRSINSTIAEVVRREEFEEGDGLVVKTEDGTINVLKDEVKFYGLQD